MAAPSEQHVPLEQHDAETLAAECFALEMEIIEEAAQSMEDTFTCGGLEACAEPVLLVYNRQDAEKTVKSTKLA